MSSVRCEFDGRPCSSPTACLSDGACRQYAPTNRVRAALDAIRWESSVMAAALGFDKRKGREIASGKETLNPAQLAWLEMLARFHVEHPPPGRGSTSRLRQAGRQD